MTLPPPERLLTEHLRLRPIDMNDVDWLCELSRLPLVRRYLLDDRIIDQDEALGLVTDSIKNFNVSKLGLWIVMNLPGEERTGFAGFTFEGDLPSLIYGLHPDYWSDGVTTEAAQSVIDYAFDRVKVSKIVADVDEPNTASIRVLQKLGMRQVRREIVRGNPLLFFVLERSPA